MEIICISCWRAFDHDTSTAAAQVSCPHCGFSQPGPDPSSLSAKLDANTRPSEVVSEAKESEKDTSTTDPEMPVMQATPPPKAPEKKPTPPPKPAPTPSANRPETMDFGAIPPDGSAPPPSAPLAKEPEAPAPPKPDHRWRLKTPTAMVLYFPDYEAMSRYLSGDEGPGYAVACGPGPFRTLNGFISAMRVTSDPLEALVNVPPDDETAPLGSNMLSSAPSNTSAQAPQGPSSGTRPKSAPKPAQDAERPSPAKARTRRRRTSATSDFSFRKTQEQNPWPGRLLFLAIGLAAGGAAVYYVAWIGLLPGIVY